MNKKELVDIVASKKGMTIKDTEDFVNTVIDTMTEALVNGDKVLLSGFGTLNVNNRNERKGVSPKTKEFIVIPASRTVTFKPSQKLKDKLN